MRLGRWCPEKDAGFFGRLEDVVLFEDDDFTAQFPTPESVEIKLEDEGLDSGSVERLHLKRTFFNARASFPFDCVNLDFCQYYYQRPPGMLRINKTVERFLEWQKKGSSEYGSLQEFVLSVTCRHDARFPQEAAKRLRELVRRNCNASEEYRLQLKETRSVAETEQWAEQDPEDLFFTGWPKDIAQGALELGWSMEVLEYVYYRRTGDDNEPYVIVCLVAKFAMEEPVTGDLVTAMFALDQNNRRVIDEIEPDSDEGRALVRSLASIVAVRNEQARRKQRQELPAP